MLIDPEPAMNRDPRRVNPRDPLQAGWCLAVVCAVSFGWGATLAGCTEQRTLTLGDPNAAFSYEPWEAVLKAHVDPETGLVDYDALGADRTQLDAFAAGLGNLSRETYDGWSKPDQIALWINAYNAMVLATVVDHSPIEPSASRSLIYPEDSIQQIPDVWDSVSLKVMDQVLTLNHIEHEILRKLFAEPRIHVAINCASAGCPPLRAERYRGSTLDAQLEAQVARYLGDPRHGLRLDGETVHLSKIFSWFGEDFAAPGQDAERAVLDFAAAHFEAHGDPDRARALRGDVDVEWIPYDWSLNRR
jgi:Protein of unknown function, DUF547